MTDRRAFAGFCSLVLLLVAGCGGGGGGLSLSGGSIPSGRAVEGTAVLPDSTPLSGATVSVVTLPSDQPLAPTTTTDSTGHFLLNGVSTTSDVALVLRKSDGTTLKVAISRSNLTTNPSSPLDVGQVDATTTLVCEAVEKSSSLLPDDVSQITTDQPPYLKDEADNESGGTHERQRWISDPSYRSEKAAAIIQKAANAELARLASKNDDATAKTALKGVNSFLVVERGSTLRPSSPLQAQLITAQLNRQQLTPSQVAAALRSAGATGVSASDVTNDSATQRQALPALSKFGNGISAYEALLIAAMPSTHGGFHLDQAHTETFLDALLGP